MGASALADTGAMLAILDRRDPWHQTCSEALRQFRLPLLTSQPVLTELFHLGARNKQEMERVWTFVHSGVVDVARIEQPELRHVHALMRQYADRPMDFADATLVYLAEREELTTIFTIDHNDFETYRIGGRKRFRVIPSRRT